MTEAPKRISLPESEVHYLTNREMENDVAYVRADIADGMLAALEWAVERLDVDFGMTDKEQKTTMQRLVETIETAKVDARTSRERLEDELADLLGADPKAKSTVA